MVLIVALLLRGLDTIPPWVLGLGAFAVAPPLVWAGYSFLRDDELEPHRGKSLVLRVLICSARLRALVGRLRLAPARWL